MKFLIITGMSGAGKSLCVKYLEDIGYFCIDNLPPELIPKIIDIFKQGKEFNKVALIIDIRGGALFNDLIPALDKLTIQDISYEILYLEASNEVLIRRFKETRRTHPLQEGRVIEGINKEREILKDIKIRADYIIDTSTLIPRHLKQEINQLFIEGRKHTGLVISIVSFGFKYGIPIDCDLVFDVRFIPNPFYDDKLKPLTGMNEEVQNFVMGFNTATLFLEKLKNMINFLVPNYIKEGKTRLVIGIGCTGGKHRSVTIANKLYESMKKGKNSVFVDHRDIEKDNRGASK